MTTLLLAFLMPAVGVIFVIQCYLAKKLSNMKFNYDLMDGRMECFTTGLSNCISQMNNSIDQYNTNYSNISATILSVDIAANELCSKLNDKINVLSARISKKRKSNAPIITQAIVRVKKPAPKETKPSPQVKDAAQKRKVTKSNQPKHKDGDISRKTSKASSSNSVKRSAQVKR